MVPWQDPQSASFRVEKGAKGPRVLVRGPILRVLSAVNGDIGREASSSVLSVLINPKNPHTVQLGQFRDEHSEQGNSVDHKMDSIIFRVEAG